jgi:hypothetical protein
MENADIPAIKQSKTVNGFYVLLLIPLLCAAISGCTVNRVSLLTRESAGKQIKASEVKVYPSFRELRAPWRLEGMISAYTMPVMSNTPEKREALIKDTVAGLGINAVVGLQPRVGENLKRVGRSIGILANTGTGAQAKTEVAPKFIICLPPVNFKIDKTPEASELDQYLLEYVQFSFSYMKGYYVYRCDMQGANNSSILQGSVDPQALSEPIGIAPDYALLSDVEGYDEQGNIAVHRSFTLKLALTLYDLREKKPVWSKTSVGISNRSVLFHILTFGGTASETSDEVQTVRSVLNQALETLPEVKGFRPDSSIPTNKK